MKSNEVRCIKRKTLSHKKHIWTNLRVIGPLIFDMPTYILDTGLGPIVVDGFLACAPEEICPLHLYDANPSPSWRLVATNHGHMDMVDKKDYFEICPGDPV